MSSVLTSEDDDEVAIGEEGSSEERGCCLPLSTTTSHHDKSDDGVMEHFLASSTAAAPAASSSSSSSVSLLPSLQQVQYQQDGSSDQEEEEIFISIDEAMERLGIGRFQWLLLMASGLCFCGDAIAFVLLSFLSMVVQQEWHLSNETTASITSCIFAGAFCGTLVLGPAADAVGRRPIFLTSAAMISIFGMAMSLTDSYGELMVMVFCVGFGVGGSIVPFDILGM
jgi:Na+/melibiose symporter-like transporter